MHHRVKSNLQVISSLLAMQASAAKNDVVRRALADAITRISTIALMHAQLSEGSSFTSVDMASYVRSLVRNVQRTFSNSSKRVSVSIGVDELRLPLRLARPCGLIIGELVTNAYQHAFRHTKSGTIEVRIALDTNCVTIVVRDSGAGLRAKTQRAQNGGLGLQLVRLLATRQLRGQIVVSRRKGTQFTITFPLVTPEVPVEHAGRAKEVGGRHG